MEGEHRGAQESSDTVLKVEKKMTPISYRGRPIVIQNAEDTKSGRTKHLVINNHSSNSQQYQDTSVERLLREVTDMKSWHHSEVSELEGVPRHFESVEEYVRVFEHLLFQECRAKLKNTWEKLTVVSSEEHTVVRVKTVEKQERGWYDVVVLPVDVYKWAFEDGEVAVLSTRRPGSDNTIKNDISTGRHAENQEPEDTAWVAGTVRRKIPIETRDLPNAVIHFYLGNSYNSQRLRDDHVLRKFESKSIWYMNVLGSLATTQRQYTALRAFRHFNLQMQIAILKPIPESYPKYAEQPPDMAEGFFTTNFVDHLQRAFNAPQLAAIQSVARFTAAGTKEGPAERQDSWPFTLVQGPKGTGKRHTVWGMLNVVHLVQYQQYYTALLKKLKPESYELVNKRNCDNTWSGALDDIMRSMDQDLFCTLPKLCPKARLLVCAPSDAATDKLLALVLHRGFVDGDLEVYIPAVSMLGLESQNHAAQAVSIERRVDQFLHKGRDEVMDSMHQLKDRESQYSEQISLLWTKLAATAGQLQESVGVDADSVSSQVHNKYFLLRRLAAAEEGRDKLLVELSRLLILESRFISGSDFNVEDVRACLEASFLNEAEIVFTTLSSCSLKVFSQLTHGFDMVVIDEAAQATELAILPALSLCSGRCVLVGDAQQVPRTVIGKASENLPYSRSLFERFQQECCPAMLLSLQYTLHPQAINDFPSTDFYSGSLTDSQNANLADRDPSFLDSNVLSSTPNLQADQSPGYSISADQSGHTSSSTDHNVQQSRTWVSLQAGTRNPHCFPSLDLQFSSWSCRLGASDLTILDEDLTLNKPPSLLKSCFLSSIPALLLFAYIFIGTFTVHLYSSAFSGAESFCDALYFSTVTICSIGYGDYVPLTCNARIFVSIYLLLGRILMAFFALKMSYWLEALDKFVVGRFLLSSPRDCVPHHFLIRCLHDVDHKSRVLRGVMMKLMATVIYCLVLIFVGIIISIYMENMDVGDAVYFAIISMTTTGYGDETFKKQRCWGSVWLLLSTCIMDRLFALFVEVWLEKNSCDEANLVLRTPLTSKELEEANVPPNSKYDVLVYMLKKMKRIKERELRLFNHQFRRLEAGEAPPTQ